MKYTDIFEIDVDRDECDLVSRLSLEASFNADCTSLDIHTVYDKDNAFRQVLLSELSIKELQQLMAGVTKQVLNRDYSGGLYE